MTCNMNYEHLLAWSMGEMEMYLVSGGSVARVEYADYSQMPLMALGSDAILTNDLVAAELIALGQVKDRQRKS